MREQHKNFHERSHPTTKAKNACWITTQCYMDFQEQLIQNLKLRSRANQERLQSEITLVLLSLMDHLQMYTRELRLTVDRPTT